MAVVSQPKAVSIATFTPSRVRGCYKNRAGLLVIEFIQKTHQNED